MHLQLQSSARHTGALCAFFQNAGTQGTETVVYAAASGEPQKHRCLVRVVDYNEPENGGVTSTSAECNLREASGEQAATRRVCMRDVLCRLGACNALGSIADIGTVAQIDAYCSKFLTVSASTIRRYQ